MAKKAKTRAHAVERYTPIQVIRPIQWRIDSYALAYTLAILCALWMLVVSIFGEYGYGLMLIELMQNVYFMYTLTFSGIIVGMAEVALCGLITGFVAGWLYNKFA